MAFSSEAGTGTLAEEASNKSDRSPDAAQHEVMRC
jgi:hypothetical protein